MPDQSFQEKTESATPKKRREARQKGNVAKSVEVNSAIVLITGVVALRIFGNGLLKKLLGIMEWMFTRLSVIDITVENMPGFVLAGVGTLGIMVAPIIVSILIAGVTASVVQTGFLFTGEPLIPKFEKISPAKGFKRMFSLRSFVEMLKGILKLLIIGIIGYLTLKSELNAYPYLLDRDVIEIVVFFGRMAFLLALRTGIALVILAGFDWIYQKYEFEKGLKMTKQEVKEEFKSVEGDPQVKARIKSIQRERARQRMFADVPTADVVVTNPIHLAVAMKYDAEKGGAPIVVAKGARLIAQRIKDIARAHDVPVIENKPLARMLYKTTEIGAQIPYELYKAVAEILAYVYRLKRNRIA